MIFSRNRGPSGRHAARRRERDEFGYAAADDAAEDAADEPADESTEERPTRRRARGRQHGPYDLTEAPEGVDRLDLGSLQIPAVDGVEVRIQADPDGEIKQVVLVNGGNALQLGVFAAPRSEGIWDEVREEIRRQLFNDGVAVEEQDGEYGVELRARVRSPEGLTDIRFVGIDGPRWMVRAVYQGDAAVDPDLAKPLTECLRGLVVARGAQAMPVREPLALRLPREIAERSREAAGDPQPGAASGSARVGAGATASGGGRRRPSPRPRPNR